MRSMEMLYPRLTPAIRRTIQSLSRQEARQLTEIRVRIGRPCLLVFCGGQRAVGEAITRGEMDELLSALSGYSLYACERQMAQGFIPLPGGHRAGVCGRVSYEDGRIVRMSGVSSVCIRIARDIPDASRAIQRYLLSDGRPQRVLLLGPPGCGKTTVLRDAATMLARERSFRVAVADEREELFGGVEDGGPLDVLLGAERADAIRLLVRSMAPQVIVTDEIGRMEDAQALLDAAACGVGVLASAHGSGIEDVLRRPALRRLFDAHAFDAYILLEKLGVCAAVWDAQGRLLKEDGHDELGSGGDGDDRNQRDRISAGRWRAQARSLDSGDAPMPSAPERRRAL